MIVQELPRRRNFVRNIVTIDEEDSYAPTMDDIIIDTIQYIKVPFDRILESPRGTPLLDFILGTPNIFFEQCEISGTQCNDRLLFPPPQTTANDINWSPTPPLIINIMAGNIPIGNVPPPGGNPLLPPRWCVRNITGIP